MKAIRLLALTLLVALAACNPRDTQPPPTPSVQLTVSTQELTHEGGLVHLSWVTNHVTNVLVTSDNPAVNIPNPTATTNSVELHLLATTTFTLTTDVDLTEKRTVTVLPPPAVDNPDEEEEDGEEEEPEALTYTLRLTDGYAPAEIIVNGDNLPTEYKNLPGSFHWSLERAHTENSSVWTPVLQTETATPHFNTIINSAGTYSIRLQHPSAPSTMYTIEFIIPGHDVNLENVAFAEGASSNTFSLTHTGAWRVVIPDWLTTSDPLEGAGPASITVSIHPNATPDHYEGVIEVITLPLELEEETYRQPVTFTFPRFAGQVTTPWVNMTGSSAPRLTIASAPVAPQHPPSDFDAIPSSQGTLVFVFDSNLTGAATILEQSPGVTNVTTLKSLNMLHVTTSNMRATAELGSTIPGFGFTEQLMVRTPELMAAPNPLDHELTPINYFGLDWYYAQAPAYERQGFTHLFDMGLTGAGVTIAVIDRGFHPTHSETYGDRVQGIYHFATDEYNTPTHIAPQPPLPDNCNHFTHGLTVTSVAAGAIPSNPLHLRGVAPNANLILIDMLAIYPETGECLEGGVNLTWVADFLINEGDIRAQVVNASWGTELLDFLTDPSYTDNLAITAMRNAGISFVAAAGNNFEHPHVVWPARHPDAFAVGGITYSPDHPIRYTYENPGLDILSLETISGHPTEWDGTQLRYGWAAGTSVAAPQVAGLIALLLEYDPTLTPDQIQTAIEVTAHKAYSAVADETTVANGVIDAVAVLEYLNNPNHVPLHQLRVQLNGEDLPVTVRPEGASFLTPYLPIDTEQTITVTTAGNNPTTWTGSITVDALPNIHPLNQQPLQIALSTAP